MLVSEAIELLQASEVKQLKVGEDETAMLGFINLAILEIYKEFKLQERDAVITIAAGPERNYTLDGTDTNVVMSLTGHDLIAVEDIYNAYGNTLIVNDPADKTGVSMPTFNTIKFKDEDLEEGTVYTVSYRAAPEFLTSENDEIPLRPGFFEALFSYVGYKAHKSVRGDNAGEHRIHMKNYRDAINTIHRTGVYNEDSLSCNKFDDRGFV